MAKFYKVTRFFNLSESAIDEIMDCGTDYEAYDDDEVATSVSEVVDVFKTDDILAEIGEDAVSEWLNKQK